MRKHSVYQFKHGNIRAWVSIVDKWEKIEELLSDSGVSPIEFELESVGIQEGARVLRKQAIASLMFFHKERGVLARLGMPESALQQMEVQAVQAVKDATALVCATTEAGRVLNNWEQWCRAENFVVKFHALVAGELEGKNLSAKVAARLKLLEKLATGGNKEYCPIFAWQMDAVERILKTVAAKASSGLKGAPDVYSGFAKAKSDYRRVVQNHQGSTATSKAARSAQAGTTKPAIRYAQSTEAEAVERLAAMKEPVKVSVKRSRSSLHSEQ